MQTNDILLTIGGVAIVAPLLVQFLIKPFLRPVFPEDENGDRDARYKAVLNLSTLLLSWILTFVATAISGDMSPDMLLQAFLIGLFGAGSATGLYEATTNGSEAVRSQ